MGPNVSDEFSNAPTLMCLTVCLLLEWSNRQWFIHLQSQSLGLGSHIAGFGSRVFGRTHLIVCFLIFEWANRWNVTFRFENRVGCHRQFVCECPYSGMISETMCHGSSTFENARLSVSPGVWLTSFLGPKLFNFEPHTKSEGPSLAPPCFGTI